MASIVLTVLGDDNPGLVDALSGVVKAHGGNWEESRMAQLAGKFAGLLLVTVPDPEADPLIEALRALSTRGLRVTAERAALASSEHDRRMRALELTGTDRPGIVYDITHALAARSVNIESLETETVAASMSGGTLFQARARLSVPAAVSDEDLRATLEGLANELMVDLAIGARD